MESRHLVNNFHKKIIVVSNTSWFCYNFCLGLMDLFKKGGYEVIAVAPYDEFTKMIVERGYKFIELKSLSRSGINPVKDWNFIVELIKLYRKEKPAIALHFTIKPSLYGAISARLANIKSISVDVGLGYLFIKKSPITLMIKILYRISCALANKLIVQNHDDKLIIAGNTLYFNKNVAIISALGVDTRYFSPNVCGEKNKDKIIFLMFCRLVWTKGIKEYVEAAREVKKIYPNIEFWLLGPIDRDHPAAIAEEEIIRMQNEGSITYLPFIQDHRSYICKADVVVLPSYREGLPSSNIEAMAMEKPIITTNAPGCRETIEDGVNGFIVPINNVKVLANAMIKMIKIGENGRKKMGVNGRKKVLKDFDKKIVFERYMAIIEDVINHN